MSQKNVSQRLMGRKCGMTQRFDKQGNVVACTLIAAEPNVITQIKTEAVDGYEAIQLAFEQIKSKDERRTQRLAGKPRSGHFKKAGVAARRFLKETRLSEPTSSKVGEELTVAIFSEGDYVDVSGVSIGKGYQGVLKLYNMRGGRASHGSGFHRHMGSTGMRSTPGICFKGGRRASQMGNRKVTVQNLRVVGVDVERGILLVEGAVPGYKGALVTVSSAKKKQPRKG